MQLWKCGVCNFLYEGAEAPEKCPKCGAAKENFTALTAEQVEMITKSRRTNQLHMQLATLMDTIQSISQEGIGLNLDPPCVVIFNKAMEQARLTQQMIKAELEGHMKKGKWG
ncbi:MAG: hypothetical protein WA118_13100 [Carboxydocellales bacterium]